MIDPDLLKPVFVDNSNSLLSFGMSIIFLLSSVILYGYVIHLIKPKRKRKYYRRRGKYYYTYTHDKRTNTHYLKAHKD